MVVYWEGLLEGVIGIPAGLLLGIIFSKITLYGLEKYFLFEGGLSADISFGMLLKLVLTGILMILLACYTPAVTAANTTGIELISGQYKMDESVQRRTDLLKRHRVFGLCGILAVKNIWARRKNYTFNGMLLVFTFCLLLDGLTAMRAFNGEYDLKDERERPDLQLWVELYTEDTEKIQSFYEQVLAFDEIKTLSLERILDLQGGLLGKDQIKEGAGNCQIASYYGYVDIARKAQDVRTGKTHSGYWIQPEIVGLDERTFQAYVERAGYEVPEKVQYPVLIEDYVRVQKGEERKRKSILKPKAGGVFSFLYSRYGDMDSYALYSIDNSGAKFDEILKGELYVVGMTDQAPPYPYFSGDYEEIEGNQATDMGKHKFYMPMQTFEKLIQDPAYKDTYGKHPKNTVVEYSYEEKEIPTYLKFDIHRTGADRIKEDKAVKKKIEAIAVNLGLAREDYRFGSSAIWKREQYFNSKEFLEVVLGYGVVLFITVISMTSIFQNISMSMRIRKREFSTYQSMGMTRDMLRKMIMLENTAYGVIGCVIGIPLSFAFLDDVWKELELYGEIEHVIPWDLIGAEFLLAVLLMIVPMLYTKMQMKHLNIIEAVQDENV